MFAVCLFGTTSKEGGTEIRTLSYHSFKTALHEI